MAEDKSIVLSDELERRVSEAGIDELGEILAKLLLLDAKSARVKGLVLRQAKARCAHGEWASWLAKWWPLSASEARRYMSIVDEPRSLREPAKRARAISKSSVLNSQSAANMPEVDKGEKEPGRDWAWCAGALTYTQEHFKDEMREWLNRNWTRPEPAPQVARPRIEGEPLSKEQQARKGKPK